MKKIEDLDETTYDKWSYVALAGLVPISDGASLLFPLLVAAETLEAAATTAHVIIAHRLDGYPGS